MKKSAKERAKEMVQQMTFEEAARPNTIPLPLNTWVFRNTTGGMKRFMASSEPGQQPVFLKPSDLPQPSLQI